MNLQRLSNSLVTRLILFGVVLVVAGGIARYIFLTRFVQEDLFQIVSSQQLSLAQSIANDVDYKVEERKRFLEHLAGTLPRELLARPEALRDWLKERHLIQPLFSLGLAVADSEGKVIADWPTIPGRQGAVVASNPDFQTARGGQFVIGRPMLGRFSKQPVLPMGAPIRNGEGRVIAVLGGASALATPGFLDRLQQERIGRGGSFLLVSPRDRVFVSAGDPAMVLQPTPAPGVNVLHDRAMAGYRGVGVTINAQGVEELSAMASVPSTGWFVVARLPMAEAMAPVERVQGLVVRHTFSAVVIVLITLSVMLAWVLRPLHSTADKADRMTRGELPLEPLPVVRLDEVGHLTMAFNRLLAKLAASQKELERLASHDVLTGLPNRMLLDDRIDQALARAKRTKKQLALLYMDLDGFKPINDSLGHKAGDEALLEIVRRILANIRQSDTLARVGGDEFVLLTADLEPHELPGCHALADKCIAAVAEPLSLHGTVCHLGISIGIAVCGGSQSREHLLNLADQAMYAAKQRGGSCYTLAPGCRDLCHACVVRPPKPPAEEGGEERAPLAD